MNLVRLLPVLLSILLLAAHFFRAGQSWLVLLVLALPVLLFFRRRWVPMVFTLCLSLGALEWVRTAVTIAAYRSAVDEPWTRMALILGAVALFTACSAGVFRLSALRARYAGRGEA